MHAGRQTRGDAWPRGILNYMRRPIDTDGRLISRDRELLSGAAVFAGTRVPVRTLIDYLESGETLDSFLADFPTVTRDQTVAALEAAKGALLASAS